MKWPRNFLPTGSAATIAVLLAFAPAAQSASLLPEPDLPAEAYRYVVSPPPHLSGLARLDNAPAGNPVTDAGAALGRVLFHDRGLSANGLVSCSSCHAQASGFDDPTRFSIGFEGRITRRSAMALANARYNPRGRYFRDERASTLEKQVLMPFADGIEMGLQPGELVRRVASRPWYPPLFDHAFGDPTVTEERIASALAQFVRALVSWGSRYDAARAAGSEPLADFAEFSAQENRGKFLFLAPRESGGAGCAQCHRTDAFVMLEPRDNGLPPWPGHEDEGVGETTGQPEDRRKFRAPSLKNIAVSAPYMHDGRFATLDEVVEHYSSGIGDSPNLDPALRDADGRPLRSAFPQEDRDALLAFLQTLTDEAFLVDPRFSDPFRKR